MKVLKIFGFLILITLLLFGGIYLGSQLEQTTDSDNLNRGETTKAIAIVNLDEGVYLSEELKYYSNDFLLYPNDAFVATGLEDARRGINEGRYAAYLLVPATFSSSIESINDNPRKSLIEYSVNPNLKESVRTETIDNIREFQFLLNTSISYVYVSSILEEFHDSQDASKVVLKNNEKNMKHILSVDGKALIEKIIFSDTAQAGELPDPLDVTGQFGSSGERLSKFEKLMQEDMDMGLSTLEGIKESRKDYIALSDDLLELLDSFYPGHDLSGESVYDDGVDELRQAIDVFNYQQIEKRDMIVDYLYEMIMQDQIYLDERIPQLQEEVDGQYDEFVTQTQISVDQQLADIQAENHEIIALEMESIRQQLQEYVDQQLMIQLFELREVYEEEANRQLELVLDEIGYYATPSNATPSNATPSDAIPSEDDLPAATPSDATPGNAYKIELASPSDATIDLSQAGDEGISLFEKIFPLKRAVSGRSTERDAQTDVWILIAAGNILFPDGFVQLPMQNRTLYMPYVLGLQELYVIAADPISQILEEQILAFIEEANEIQRDAAGDSVLDLTIALREYEDELNEFDPYGYLPIDRFSATIGDIYKELGDIENLVYKNADLRDQLVDEIHGISMENVDALRVSMDEANEKTLENILKTVTGLQNTGQEITEENSTLLLDFTQKLSYTRVGSLGARDAYDFIVNPVVLTSGSAPQNTVLSIQSYVDGSLLAAFLLLAGLVGGMAVYAVMWTKNKMKREGNSSVK